MFLSVSQVCAKRIFYKNCVLVCTHINFDEVFQPFFFVIRTKTNASLMIHGILPLTIKKPQTSHKHLLYFIKY